MKKQQINDKLKYNKTAQACPVHPSAWLCLSEVFVMNNNTYCINDIEESTLLSLINHICERGAVDEKHKNFRVNFYNYMMGFGEERLSSYYTLYAGGDPQVIDKEIEEVNKLADYIYLGMEKMEAKGKLSEAIISRWSNMNKLRTRSANFQGSIQI